LNAESLIKDLMAIQKRRGCVSDEEARKLVEGTEISLARVEELRSFFPHLRPDPAKIVEIEICRDMTCHLRDAAGLIADVKKVAGGRSNVAVHEVSCLGRCDRAPAVRINHQLFVGRTRANLCGAVDGLLRGETPPPDSDHNNPGIDPSGWRIDIYEGPSDFRALKKVFARGDSAWVIDELKKADLRGMGGAGEEAQKKWGDVRRAPGDVKYVVCNADESEPATFKDREILLRKPHLVVEGIAIAAVVVGAKQGYVYLRDEYPEQALTVQAAIDAFHQSGAAPTVRIEIFRSPGGYICGEQTALIEAMESKRAEPRNRPPQLQTNGLRNRPTLLNNVETLAWVPGIVDEGAGWYRGDTHGKKGRRFFSISGDVAKPGVYDVPIGRTLRDLIFDPEFAGGMRDKLELQAVAHSGPSGGFLPPKIPLKQLARKEADSKSERFLRERLPAGASHLNVLELELDFSLWRDLGPILGAGLVVYGSHVDMASQARNALEFFARETCGKCVPCRIGTQKLIALGHELLCSGAPPNAEREEVVRQLGRTMKQTSICGLGTSAPAPLTSFLDYFRASVAIRTHGALRGAQRASAEDAAAPIEEEPVFARHIDGQLIRQGDPSMKQYKQEVSLVIDGCRVIMPEALPLVDHLGDMLIDDNGDTIPRATTIYDAAVELFDSKPGRPNPIPILCHQPHLRPVGVCRVCVVLIGKKLGSDGLKIKWERKLLPACQHPIIGEPPPEEPHGVKDGMIVLTSSKWDEKKAELREWLRTELGQSAPETEIDRHLQDLKVRVEGMRKSVTMLVELLTADHLLTEDHLPTADDSNKHREFDGSRFNELWALKDSYKATGRIFPPRAQLPRLDQSNHDKLLIDHSACILCDRCIRGCSDVRQNHVIGRTGKGKNTSIGFDLNVKMSESTCVECGECLISCPTSAITKLDLAAPPRPEETQGRMRAKRKYGVAAIFRLRLPTTVKELVRWTSARLFRPRS
jgi:formate dehydrogenase beta subunit